MLRAALIALTAAFFIAMLAYAASFRRSFLGIPEAPDPVPCPDLAFLCRRQLWSINGFCASPPQCACYHFVVRTLLRSELHLQILAGFTALGLALTANTMSPVTHLHTLLAGKVPSEDVLSAPFILSFCMVAGVRFAFEIPADLRANWVFRFWLEREGYRARTTARYVLLVFSVGWLAPLAFLATLAFWGWTIATLHAAILVLSTSVLAEISLLRFRKLPCTCSYPPFQSYSGLVVVAYWFGFIFFTGYLVEFERWSLFDPWRVLAFGLLGGLAMAAVRHYRRHMLMMDKELLFEELQVATF